jgi:hypothetical protein
MDSDQSSTDIEQLLANFLSAAAGLILQDALRDSDAVRAQRHSNAPSPHTDPPVWAAWKTARGTVSACGTYDRTQSQRLGANVLHIEWWIAPDTHHEGWWHCYAKRPGEWIKGRGGEPIFHSGVLQSTRTDG